MITAKEANNLSLKSKTDIDIALKFVEEEIRENCKKGNYECYAHVRADIYDSFCNRLTENGFSIKRAKSFHIDGPTLLIHAIEISWLNPKTVKVEYFLA